MKAASARRRTTFGSDVGAMPRSRGRAARFFRLLCALLAAINGLWCMLQPSAAVDSPEIVAIRQLYTEAQA
jgi:hypothetical protein